MLWNEGAGEKRETKGRKRKRGRGRGTVSLDRSLLLLLSVNVHTVLARPRTRPRSIHPSILPSFLLSNLFYLSTHVFCINFIGSFHHTQLSLSPCLYEVTQWFYNWLSPARPPGRPPLYHYHHQLGCFIILYLVFLVSIALFEQVLRKIMMSVAFKWGDGFEQKQITNPDATMQH